MAEYKLAAAVGAREWGHPAVVGGGEIRLVVHDAIGVSEGMFWGAARGWLGWTGGLWLGWKALIISRVGVRVRGAWGEGC